MDIGDPELPVRLERGSEEASQSPVDDHHRGAAIPTEDSYFNGHPPRSQTVPFVQDLRNLGVILNNRRRAATQHVTLRGAGAAWIDQDDSGTYDPKKERATPPATPIAPRQRSRTLQDEDENEASSSKARKPHRRIGYRSILTFSFTSNKALDYLRSIPPGPYDSQSPTPDAELSDSSVPQDDVFGPLLRRRKVRRSTRQRETAPR